MQSSIHSIDDVRIHQRYGNKGVCPTAKILFENYANAAMEQFEAADVLATLMGQHGQFEEAKKHAEQAHEKCSIARSALEQHRAQHGCRQGIANGW